jgi:hypothetical protein
MESEETKAVQEVAKFGTRALDSVDKLGSFLARMFGTVPEDTIGVIGGDWLKHIRVRNAARLGQRTEEILRERGILDKTEPMSPSVALPLLEAAQDETREELREMWAHLLANGMDPDRQGEVRRVIIETVKKLDPLDAVVLKAFDDGINSGRSALSLSNLVDALHTKKDEIRLSLTNLTTLGCVNRLIANAKYEQLRISTLGREIIRSCS